MTPLQTANRDQAATLFRAYGRVSWPALATLALAVALVLRLGLGVLHWQSATVDKSLGHVQQSGPDTREVDLAAVQALRLFGDSKAAQAGTAAARAKVATTDLDLSLEGVVLASDPLDSVAFIISNGQQHSYKSGDTLPVSAGVTLAAIARDHVLIRNNGIEQALWLYSTDNHQKTAKGAASAGKTRGQAAQSATGSGGATAALLQAAPQQVRKVAARLAEIIEVAPAAANGQLLGYRLSPGSRLKDFVQLGFKTSDIVTSINGIALNDMANLPELYSLMNKPGDVSFSLLRDGQPLTLQMTLAP